MEIVKDIIQSTNDKALSEISQKEKQNQSKKVNVSKESAKQNNDVPAQTHQNLQTRPNIISQLNV